jgi:hypothetical protein
LVSDLYVTHPTAWVRAGRSGSAEYGGLTAFSSSSGPVTSWFVISLMRYLPFQFQCNTISINLFYFVICM